MFISLVLTFPSPRASALLRPTMCLMMLSSIVLSSSGTTFNFLSSLGFSLCFVSVSSTCGSLAGVLSTTASSVFVRSIPSCSLDTGSLATSCSGVSLVTNFWPGFSKISVSEPAGLLTGLSGSLSEVISSSASFFTALSPSPSLSAGSWTALLS